MLRDSKTIVLCVCLSVLALLVILLPPAPPWQPVSPEFVTRVAKKRPIAVLVCGDWTMTTSRRLCICVLEVDEYRDMLADFGVCQTYSVDVTSEADYEKATARGLTEAGVPALLVMTPNPGVASLGSREMFGGGLSRDRLAAKLRAAQR